MKRLILLLLWCSTMVISQAQTPDETPETIIEDLIGQEDGDVDFDFDTQFEILQRYARRPLNLNTADRDDLNTFGLLTSVQVDALINYRNTLGDFISIYEMQAIPLFDLATINRILPYVTVTDRLSQSQTRLLEQFAAGDNELFTQYRRNIENAKGYLPDEDGNTPYQGDPSRFYVRYRHTFQNNLSYGITMEKDAGEQLRFGNGNNGFDYYSGHIFLKNITPTVKYLALGDFEVRFGQGLILWSGFGNRKSSLVTNIKRQSPPIKQYTSVNEATFLRGGGATFQFSDNLRTTVFASIRQRDGRFNDLDTTDIDDDFLSISSLQISGLHRTQSELAAKNTISQLTFGANIEYEFDNGQIGINGVYHALSAPINRSSRPYNQFLFNDDNLLNLSIDYTYSIKNFYFFGETALSQNLGIASLNGMILSLNRNINFAALYRHYEKDYWHLSGSAFGERSAVNNEYGLYLGVEVIPNRQWNFSFYADQWRFPWLTFSADAPSRGYEYLANVNYKPTRKSNLELRYRLETKEQNASNNDTPTDFLVPVTRQQARLSFNYAASSAITLKSRVEFSKYENTVAPISLGFLMYQEVKYRTPGVPISFSTRYSLFDTDDFNTRIYAYESDLLYSFSVPAFSGKGQRYYLNVSYRLPRNILIEGRIARTVFSNQETVGSGLEEIDGNTRTEAKIQARWRF